MKRKKIIELSKIKCNYNREKKKEIRGQQHIRKLVSMRTESLLLLLVSKFYFYYYKASLVVDVHTV